MKVGKTQTINVAIGGAFRLTLDFQTFCGLDGPATAVWIDPPP